MNKILIIEDDLEINALLADFLKEKGYAIVAQLSRQKSKIFIMN